MHRFVIPVLLYTLAIVPVRADQPAPVTSLAQGAVDETALRYYAATRQQARRDAEAQRLQLLHPGWRVPDDLDREEAGREDEAPLWDLFAKDRLEDLAAAMARRRAAEPGWVPSAALQRKLEHKTRRASVLNAFAARRWSAAVEAAGGASDLDVDVLWAVAEAQARLGRDGDAATGFRTALGRARSAHERLVTLRNALATLPFGLVEPLLPLDGQDATRHSEFAALADEVTRARLVSALASTDAAATMPDDALRDFASKANTDGNPADMALLGWWALRRQSRQEAVDWFTRALEAKPDPLVAHGLAVTLDQLGRDVEAEDLAFRWREESASNALLYIEIASRAVLARDGPPASPERIARLARAARQLESGEAAQALAWTAMRSCQFKAAAEWFRLALAWRPRESTAKGAALALLRLERRSEAAAILNRYDGLFPSVVALAFDTGDRSAEACGPAPAARVLRSIATPTGTVRVVLPFPASTTMESTPATQRPGTTSLVARRVPGAGAMPYEAYGFALLLGWNGADGPTVPAYADRRAARGTIDGDGRPFARRPLATAEASGLAPARTNPAASLSVRP